MIESIRRTARGSSFALLLLLPGRALLAQTSDEARLTMGISVGWIGSSTLWDIPQQRIASTFEEAPSFWHLQRELRSDITVSGHITLFPTPHLGYTGEFTYLGLGTVDGCTTVIDDGDLDLETACNALKGHEGSASVTTVQGGMVYRPLTRTTMQPYFKGMVGLAFTPTSTIAMSSVYGNVGDTLLIVDVYTDDAWHSIRTSWAAAAGIATAPSSGYQLRLEFRETWLPLRAVTGANALGQGFVPPSKSVIKGFPSIMVGFDVVLEKRRGRRY